MKNLAAMESSILHELAAFDVRAPIDVTITFEDEEVIIKTEDVIDDDNIISENTNDTRNFLEPNKEIKEEVEKYSNELNTNKHLEQNIETKQIQDTNSERKRKQTLLQIYENKRGKKESTQENVPNHLSSHNKENETLQSLISNSNFTHQGFDTSQLNPTNNASTADVPYSNEDERKKITSYIISYLTAVSENMRLIMEAYAYHRQHNTPYDCFKKQKIHCFNQSYNTVVKLIMPEIQNKEFILNFIRKSYEHALKTSPLCKFILRDFEILFKELLGWVKDKKKREAKKANQLVNIVQPTLTGSKCCQGPVVENTHVYSSNNRTEADTICIFSSGSPGNQPGTQANNKNKCLQELLQRSPQIQPSFPDIRFPQSVPSTQALPQNEQLAAAAAAINIADRQSTHAPSLYGQLIRPPPPSYVPPVRSRTWHPPAQSQVACYQTIQSSHDQSKQQTDQSQLVYFQNIQPRYDQLKHIQQYGQPQYHKNMLPQYEQYLQVQSQIGQLQKIQPQNAQVPTRQTQSILPQHISSHSGQPPPVLPECEQRLQIGEWHQGLNELYHHQGQTQQQIHKTAPRSTSTDSGFISPLNFNTSSDQTVPPVPDHTESAQILITHVTSLNPKVPLIAEGLCVICNKTTKKVCMGCMKIYYCTYECQLRDWPKHGPDCYNQRTTTTLK